MTVADAGEDLRADLGTVDPRDLVRLHPSDNVCVAARDIVAINGSIGAGHKIATARIPAMSFVVKYGQVIGVATCDVEPGTHMHAHNMRFARGVTIDTPAADLGSPPVTEGRTFDGIVRSDGSVGTRNYLGLLTTVNCSATAARQIADRFRHSDWLADFPMVDGVVPLIHGTGCGIGDPTTLTVLRRTLRGYLRHPNFAGIVVLGLGCEHNQITELVRDHDMRADLPVEMMTIQELGGTRRTVEAGIDVLRAMLLAANSVRRQPVPVSALILGTNCGGSDGLSGLTANPALGRAVDLLTAHGGSGVLGETPEIYGAEHLLVQRAVSEEVGRKLLDRIKWWERHVGDTGGRLDNNPTPGNKAGGLTTIAEKSLGSIAKGGTGPLVDVVEYAEPIHAKGLTVMDTPGYDPVSVTGIVAGGAQVMCFTTGRGSAFGCKPVPSIKIATNTAVYERMIDDMDVNAGVIVDGTASVAEVGERIFRLVIETASGRQTKSEKLGYGDEEFMPWRVGAVI